MATVGDFTFPQERTSLDIQTRIVDGQTRKVVRIDTIILGFGSNAQFLANVELLEGEIELFDQGEVSLSATQGRYYEGRRLRLERTIDEKSRFAAFEIELLTHDRYERSQTLHQENLTITASGDYLDVDQEGNTHSPPQLQLTATGNLVKPVLSDGERSLYYWDTLQAGNNLVIDCDLRTAKLNGSTNVLGKIAGSFPLLVPGESSITYTDDPSSTHNGTLLAKYRDRWV